jgi:hypothetical protein
MSRRNKIIIAVLGAIIVILLIFGLIWWLNNRQGLAGRADTNQGLEAPSGLPQIPAGLTNTAESPVKEPKLEANLKATAFTFAERFGSYSNQGNFSNLDDLRVLMTTRMKAWTDNYKASQKTTAEGATYYGITTQALSVQISEFDESLGRAEIIATTQRREAKGSTVNPKIFYQDLKLQLVKTGEGWKVDSAVWQ